MIHPTTHDVIRATAQFYGLSEDDIRGPLLYRHVTRPRQMAMYVAAVKFGKSSVQIARALNRRDHTAVLHGVKSVRALVARDPAITWEADEIADAAERVWRERLSRVQAQAKPPIGYVLSCPEVRPPFLCGAVGSPEWWSSNDAVFRAAMEAHPEERPTDVVFRPSRSKGLFLERLA